MTRENAKKLLPVIQAFADGKTIDCGGTRIHSENVVANVEFSGDPASYSIPPEPREIWVNVYPNGRYGQGYATLEQAKRRATHTGCQQHLFREVI